MRLLNWIYVSKSCISSDNADNEITKIVERSRVNNKNLDVTGVLVFDGTHFAQLVEGPEANIQDLRLSIERDRRHQEVTTILFDNREIRQLPTWSLAYSGRSLVIRRTIGRALRDTEQEQPGAGTKLLEHLITLARQGRHP